MFNFFSLHKADHADKQTEISYSSRPTDKDTQLANTGTNIEQRNQGYVPVITIHGNSELAMTLLSLYYLVTP
ncbi:hypothetical protein DN730_01515 [Marinomonas piezotolerans]|uniref:Uncharacterized protein n=1 Tax=Marinomonas piezotolerans TaxID=2213058 RepID=A0A370UD88_9GAMM|nr:hypothetical protein [Marinomonas piezotolerans]RDL45753.1 hypothetical protein DN730_01515 [Marinomonas piezotolerans]